MNPREEIGRAGETVSEFVSRTAQSRSRNERVNSDKSLK